VVVVVVITVIVVIVVVGVRDKVPERFCFVPVCSFTSRGRERPRDSRQPVSRAWPLISYLWKLLIAER
jgi:hypothetical protein